MAPKHLNLVDYHPNLAIYLSTLHNSVQFNWDSSDIRAASVVCTLEPWCGCFWYCWGQSLLQHQVQLLNNLTIIMSSWIPHTLFRLSPGPGSQQTEADWVHSSGDVAAVSRKMQQSWKVQLLQFQGFESFTQ